MAIQFSGDNRLGVKIASTSNWSSYPINIGILNQLAFEVDVTGTLSGTFYIEVTSNGGPYLGSSLNPDPAAIWKPIKSVVFTNGLDDKGVNFIVAELTTAFKFVRLRYAPAGSPGTGSFDAFFFAKSQG